jgi:hypothetical protein
MSLLTVPSFKPTINSLKTVDAALVLSALAAAPVFTQAAIQEPGALAFHYPYRDVLNGGAPTSAAKLILEPPAASRIMPPGKVASAPRAHCDLGPTSDNKAAPFE